MVLSDSPEGCAAVDVESGALVRLHYPGRPEAPLVPFSVVKATLTDDPDGPDPTQPEAVSLDGPPEVVGRLRGRRARKLLGPLMLPSGAEPLGFPGSAVPYWMAPGDRPSLALLSPEGGRILLRRSAGGATFCQYRWRKAEVELPLADRLAIQAMDAGPFARLAGGAIERAVGFRPRHLVIALSSPQDGRCYKVVSGLLPSP